MVTIRLTDRDTSTLQPVIEPNLPADLIRRYQHVPLEARFPLTDAIRDDTPVWIPNLDEYAARYPEVVADAMTAGFQASAALPLRFSDGTVGGAVAFAWAGPVRFDESLRATVTTLADLAGQAVERCRLYEAEHAVVTSLQRRLLAPMPDCDTVEAAARYEPASGAIGMGGDWYEAFVLEDGSFVAVIGDVVGHGVEAIAAMAELQHLVAGLVQSGTPLEQVLSRTSAMLGRPEPVYATAQLLHLDAARGVLGYQTAAHPWALVRHTDGRVEHLANRHHGLLGTRMETGGLDHVPIEPGALVLAYTDGLIERRNESIVDSMHRLGSYLAATDPTAPLDATLAAIVDEARAHDPGHATNDDIAAIILRPTVLAP